ncbi:MAG TPA: DUF1684 domain-containing protein [Bacteroidota bacterium]|nr:DUF1684 domain-containing protein [Bacteroidota bacterium]
MKTLCLLLATALIALTSCKQEAPRTMSGADSLRAINESLEYRRTAEDFFRNHSSSPFKTDPPVPYEGLRWYPPDAGYYFTLRLHRYERPETVVVYGTKGEPRNQIRYGWFTIPIGGKEHRLNVYKFTPDDVRRHPQLAGTLSVWFTDETTGGETYPVGRYVEIEPEAGDPDHLYVVNLNNAHNPYCAYNPSYSCAIPTREDRLPAAVRAGEMNYHVE